MGFLDVAVQGFDFGILGQEHLNVFGILGVQKILHERQVLVQHVRGDYHPLHIGNYTA